MPPSPNKQGFINYKKIISHHDPKAFFLGGWWHWGGAVALDSYGFLHFWIDFFIMKEGWTQLDILIILSGVVQIIFDSVGMSADSAL